MDFIYFIGRKPLEVRQREIYQLLSNCGNCDDESTLFEIYKNEITTECHASPTCWALPFSYPVAFLETDRVLVMCSNPQYQSLRLWPQGLRLAADRKNPTIGVFALLGSQFILVFWYFRCTSLLFLLAPRLQNGHSIQPSMLWCLFKLANKGECSYIV